VGTEGGAGVIVYFCANGISSEMGLPSVYLENARAEDLAELAAGMFWRERHGEAPSLVTLIHLQDVDGKDLGIFEVRRDMRPVFTAIQLEGPKQGGAVGVSLPATLPTASAICN